MIPPEDVAAIVAPDDTGRRFRKRTRKSHLHFSWGYLHQGDLVAYYPRIEKP